MVEAQTNEIRFPEDPREIFHDLLQHCRSRPSYEDIGLVTDDKLIPSFKVYLLAEKYAFHNVQNALIDGFLFHYVEYEVPPWLYGWVVDHVDKNSRLYRLTEYSLIHSLIRNPETYYRCGDENQELREIGRAAEFFMYDDIEGGSYDFERSSRYTQELAGFFCAGKIRQAS